ncbi:uncharacterized protein TNCV_2704851 [Trichonephila clavipes]|nr:uncharacterized protein TNCV_2704851 [Trichonephila clavipes]
MDLNGGVKWVCSTITSQNIYGSAPMVIRLAIRPSRLFLKFTVTLYPSLEKDPHQAVAAVAEWYRYRIVADFVTSSSPVPLKIRRVGQRCTLNLSRAETSSRWCSVVVRRGGASSGVVTVT